METVAERLARIPLFQGMTERALASVAELAREERFADGIHLMREGEPGDSFVVIVEGRVDVTREDKRIGELGPGEFLGEISLIDGRPRTATATAIGSVTALVIRRAEFMDLIDRFGAVRLGILMALTDRIRSDDRDPG